MTPWACDDCKFEVGDDWIKNITSEVIRTEWEVTYPNGQKGWTGYAFTCPKCGGHKCSRREI